MITVIGLGPGGLDRVPESVRSILLDPSQVVVVRTVHHPGAARLADLRQVVFCDDLYQSGETIDEVYDAIAARVIEAAGSAPVVYAVPGSPTVGEFSVQRLIRSRDDIEVLPGESFVDAILAQVGYDPMERGLQVLNGQDLPHPLVLDKPTIIGHLDHPELLAEVAAQVGRVVPEEVTVKVMLDCGSPESRVVEDRPEEIDPGLAGLRTSLWIDTEPGGLVGAVRTMTRLRRECPWDREQTHHSLVKNLVEEVYEMIDSVARLDNDERDWVTYSEVEDELGDVLLQVLFHAAIARQEGAFDIDDVAEVLRRKLVRRHPHVFGDVEVGSAGEVKANWDRIKQDEHGDADDESVLAGVPEGMPALYRASKLQNRAAKVGFDWDEPGQVLEKVREELTELEEAIAGSGDVTAELGDLLFSVVNLSRHLRSDPELALRQAIHRFDERFRRMETAGPLDGLDLDALNRRWEEAKES